MMRRQVIFKPEQAEPFGLICTSNVGKDLNHIVSQEYDIMKEKQDIRFE